jgi:hypothetical protein
MREPVLLVPNVFVGNAYRDAPASHLLSRFMREPVCNLFPNVLLAPFKYPRNNDVYKKGFIKQDFWRESQYLLTI